MRTTLILVALLFFACGATGCAGGLRWTLVNWKVRHDFPDVKRITPAETAERLKEKQSPVLLDIRTKSEYEISHIPGARRVEPSAEASAIDLPHDQPIITYCSVGYRSGAFAKKLQDAGYKNVQNMSGSIFQWANEGRPLEHAGKPTEKVHPYNATWGKLLKAPLRAEVPDAGKDM
ncbi:MAG: rhodanese-like domain-containing protein [Chthoniobacterales bacterium]